jgi:kinetochore protein Nuf2
MSSANLMSCVGIDDFSLKDVLKPESSRIKMIFSGIINFAKFREQQLIFFEESSLHAEELSNRRRLLESKIIDAQKALLNLQ